MKPAVAGALLAVVILVAAWSSRVSEGRRAIAECDGALARADHAEAIMAARAAAEARCPAFCATELGYARLYAIAKDAESRADDRTAFAAWRAVRAASLATAVLDADAPKRQRADGELARIGHRIDVVAAAGGAPLSAAASEQRLHAALASSGVPGGMTYLLLAAGGVLFLVGAARFASRKGMSRADLAMIASGAAIAAVGALFF